MNGEIHITMLPWEAHGLIKRLEELKLYEREIFEGARSHDIINTILNTLNKTCTHTYEERMSLYREAKENATINIEKWKNRTEAVKI